MLSVVHESGSVYQGDIEKSAVSAVSALLFRRLDYVFNDFDSALQIKST